MKNKNIVLIGFMGAGKSTVAKKLAALLKKKLVSTDAMIEKKEKRPIASIFMESGEAYFRSLERKVVKGLAPQRGLIIDCGGGIVLNHTNIVNLKKNGILVYLKASARETLKRVGRSDKRPLLNVKAPLKKVRGLLKTRKPFYEKADIIIRTDGKTAAEVTREVIRKISDE